MKKIFTYPLTSLVLTVAFAGCSGGGSGSGAVASQSTGPTLPASINVGLTESFTDTSIPVKAGQLITVTASGTIDYSTGHVCGGSPCEATPAGVSSASCAGFTGFLTPTLPCWSLIGRIGSDGSIFEVGANYSSTATTSGILYLGLNDNFYADNSGAWTAIVNVTTP